MVVMMSRHVVDHFVDRCVDRRVDHTCTPFPSLVNITCTSTYVHISPYTTITTYHHTPLIPQVATPKDRTPAAAHTAAVVNELSTVMHTMLENHPVNAQRRQQGENPANIVLLRGCGSRCVCLLVCLFVCLFVCLCIHVCVCVCSHHHYMCNLSNMCIIISKFVYHYIILHHYNHHHHHSYMYTSPYPSSSPPPSPSSPPSSPPSQVGS